MKKTLKERFWEKVAKNGSIPAHKPYLGRCWPWTASTNKKGYGHIKEGSPSQRTLNSHRVSYELEYGAIPTGDGYHGTCVLHSCDNPSCCNPSHLFLGTNQDNVNDMVKKGRTGGGAPSKEKNGRAKLTKSQIGEIRRDYVRGSRTHDLRALGRKYGVHNTTIGRIVRKEIW